MLKYENVNLGLLLIRLGIGASLIAHGLPKINGGPELWTKLGSSMEIIGIHFLPAFWGFMAAFAEAGGGVLLMLGVLWKPACFLLVFTMVIAVLHHAMKGETFGDYSHAMELGILFVGLFFTGPGKYKVVK